MSRFGKRPMHLFGLLGTMMFFVGFLFAGYLGISKLYAVHNNMPARLITDRPSFYIALSCMIIGTVLFVAGFLGEMISRSSHDRNEYLIREKLNID